MIVIGEWMVQHPLATVVVLSVAGWYTGWLIDKVLS